MICQLGYERSGRRVAFETCLGSQGREPQLDMGHVMWQLFVLRVIRAVMLSLRHSAVRGLSVSNVIPSKHGSCSMTLAPSDRRQCRRGVSETLQAEKPRFDAWRHSGSPITARNFGHFLSTSEPYSNGNRGFRLWGRSAVRCIYNTIRFLINCHRNSQRCSRTQLRQSSALEQQATTYVCVA